MKDGKIHITRNGGVLGAYDRDKLEDMLETGHLLPTDLFYDEVKAEWTPLSEVSALLSTPAPATSEFRAVEEAEAATRSKKRASKTGRGGSKAREKKRTEATLGGWIACLFALGVAAGLWAWAQYLRDQLASAAERVKERDQMVESLKQEKQFLLEITPRGRIRAVITYQPSPSQVAIMSGASVGLYRREDVEKALATALEKPEMTSGDGFERTIDRLKAAISAPLEIGLTDSNGRIDMGLPGPGPYVLVATATKSASTGPERFFWLIGFNALDQPSNLVLLNEDNAISMRRTQFSITDVRTMASTTAGPDPKP